jgi:hypothetical protein
MTGLQFKTGTWVQCGTASTFWASIAKAHSKKPRAFATFSNEIPRSKPHLVPSDHERASDAREIGSQTLCDSVDETFLLLVTAKKAIRLDPGRPQHRHFLGLI